MTKYVFLFMSLLFVGASQAQENFLEQCDGCSYLEARSIAYQHAEIDEVNYVFVVDYDNEYFYKFRTTILLDPGTGQHFPVAFVEPKSQYEQGLFDQLISYKDAQVTVEIPNHSYYTSAFDLQNCTGCVSAVGRFAETFSPTMVNLANLVNNLAHVVTFGNWETPVYIILKFPDNTWAAIRLGRVNWELIDGELWDAFGNRIPQSTPEAIETFSFPGVFDFHNQNVQWLIDAINNLHNAPSCSWDCGTKGCSLTCSP